MKVSRISATLWKLRMQCDQIKVKVKDGLVITTMKTDLVLTKLSKFNNQHFSIHHLDVKCLNINKSVAGRR